MFTDLFLALADPRNSPPHAVPAALAYAFCPAAARWWLCGAKPLVPYDPAWHALTKRAGKTSLMDTLKDYGVDGLADEIRRYVNEVEQHRKRLPHLASPERLPTFPGGELDRTLRNQVGGALFEHFGGDWRNLVEYCRVWAFQIQDWETGAKLSHTQDTSIDHRLIDLVLMLPQSKNPAYFPAWLWTRTQARSMRLVVGLLVDDVSRHDELRLGLALHAEAGDEKPWKRKPDVYALERRTGYAAPVDGSLTPDQLNRMIESLYLLASRSACPPLGALQGGWRCAVCGYKTLCWDGAGQRRLTDLAADFLRRCE